MLCIFAFYFNTSTIIVRVKLRLSKINYALCGSSNWKGKKNKKLLALIRLKYVTLEETDHRFVISVIGHKCQIILRFFFHTANAFEMGQFFFQILFPTVLCAKHNHEVEQLSA